VVRPASAAVARLGGRHLETPPGTAAAIDWVAALEVLGVPRLDADAAEATLGAVLKSRDDVEAVRGRGVGWLVGADRA
jgi:hypothetical protein